MQNLICEGKTIKAVAVAAIDSGDLVLVGAKVVVAQNDAAINAEFIGQTKGVYNVPKEAGAITIGQALYLKAGAKTVTTTAAENTFCGYAHSAAAAGAATVDLLIVDGTPVTAATVAVVATVNGSDAATTQALANALKVTVNEMLVSLKAAGLMA